MSNDQKPLIEIKDMSKTYTMGEVKVHALNEVSLSIRRSEVTVILGPSGCGKTTLLNQIGGIDSPTSGSLIVEGHQMIGLTGKQLTKYRQDHIGFVFQFFNLIPNLTAKENVEFVLEYVLNLPSKIVKTRSEELLEKVGLGGRGDHYPYQLSGGEQQRVSIARALSKDPTILLADEPTGELDYGTGKMILELLVKFAEEGKAVLIVTHNKEIARIAHNVFHLRDGKIFDHKKINNPIPVSMLEW